ncbi:MAG: hypothetical protein AABX54_02305 [Nanoarchaeota archaeon]
MRFGDVFDLFFKIILLILAIIIIVWELQLLFGGSPTVEELLIGIIFIIGGFVFNHHREIGVIKNEMKHNFLNIKNSFDSIKQDISSIKKDINLIKKRLKV